MMKKLHEILLAKDKKAMIYLVMLAALGILLLVLGNGLFLTPSSESAVDLNLPGLNERAGKSPAGLPEGSAGESAAEQTGSGAFFIREQELEQRLEEAFALMENVGKVRVLVSLSPDTETVYAKDTDQTDSFMRETDSQGGTRETRDQSKQEETIMFTDSTGTDRPLVLREIDQKIEGAVIIAEGGDNVFVKDALTKAACTILGIEANKVQVLKMKI